MAIALCGCSALAAALGTSLPAGADGEVLEKLPAGTRDVQLIALQARTIVAPRDAQAVVALGERYLALAARSADERYLGYAAQALAAMPRPERSPALVLLQAQLLQRQHDFAGARAELTDFLKRDSRNGEAHLLWAYIDMAQGEPASARAHCIAAVLIDPFAAAHCAARAQSLLGDNAGAARHLEQLLARTDLSATQRQDLQLTLAEIAERDGRDADAENYLRAILDGDSEQPLARLRLADLSLRRAQWRACLRVTDGATQPALLLRRTIAAQALQLGEAAAMAQRLQRYFAIETQRNPDYASRDYALYLLHVARDSAQALDIARRNWRTQREPDDALALVQAARAAGAGAVAEVAAWRQRTQVQDMRLDREAIAQVSRR